MLEGEAKVLGLRGSVLGLPLPDQLLLLWGWGPVSSSLSTAPPPGQRGTFKHLLKQSVFKHEFRYCGFSQRCWYQKDWDGTGLRCWGMWGRELDPGTYASRFPV